MDLDKFSDCLKLVDIIIENGGYGTVRIYLASVMTHNDEAYEEIMQSTIHGETVKELIQMNDEILLLKTYVEISGYRAKVMKSIGTETKIPTVIANESGILPNHISKVLKELKDKDLAVCINEETRKGRLYRLTDKGLKVLGELK